MPGFQVERLARRPAGLLAIRLWVVSILLSRQQDGHVGRPGPIVLACSSSDLAKPPVSAC